MTYSSFFFNAVTPESIWINPIGHPDYMVLELTRLFWVFVWLSFFFLYVCWFLYIHAILSYHSNFSQLILVADRTVMPYYLCLSFNAFFGIHIPMGCLSCNALQHF